MSRPVPATDAAPRVTLGVSLKLYMSIAETRAWAAAVARLDDDAAWEVQRLQP